MKLMRGICVSRHEEPGDWNDYKDGVWIQCNEKISVPEAIKAAMRMRADEIVITSDCFGWFKV